MTKQGKSEKRISGEAYYINEQIIHIYSAEARNSIKGALRPGARTGPVTRDEEVRWSGAGKP